MKVKATVTLEIEVDLTAWRYEYGSDTVSEALDEALRDLREPGWYFYEEKWRQLATVKSVATTADLGPLGKYIEE